jgi:methyltransferase (TIGR00027 family)
MLKSLKRIVYPVADLPKAKEWYGRILGVQPLFDAPFASIFKVGECTLSLVKKELPPVDSAERVETFWEVEDIDAAYQRLIDSGASPHTPIRNVLNIRTAKVLDPFGNIIGITGTAGATQERTVEEQPSSTAMTVAFCRALAARDEREEIKGPDYLAELFLLDEAKKLLHDHASRQWAIQHLVTPQLYGYFVARTCFVDDVVRSSLAGETPQIVLLGAGYDTRAWRFRDDLHNTRYFELDIRPTQTRKRDVLCAARVDMPSQVTFVDVDFKKDDLAVVLKESGLDPKARTLFILEGVTYYLDASTIRATLKSVREVSAPGSVICFDYMTEKLDSVNPSEPFKFWIGSTEIHAYLSASGFDMVEHLDSREMERRYLTLHDGTRGEKALPYFCFVQATVPREIPLDDVH